jgi:predicted alpha/beta-hydrolase family hydrolase
MIFTHGAKGALDSPAMVNFAAGFSASKALVNFLGSSNLKSRTEMFRAVMKHQAWDEALGGRSMGARAAVVASHGEDSVKALVLVSYPLKNDKGELRDQILLDLDEGVHVLFISGDRDSMCDLPELDGVRRKMKAKSWLVIASGADHGMNMKPKKATDDIGRLSGELAAKWFNERNATWTESSIGWNGENETVFQSPWSSRQELAAGVAANSATMAQSQTSAGMEIVSPKDTAEKSNGHKKIVDQKQGGNAKSRKRELKSELALDTSGTRQTRSKRRKPV